MTLKKRKRINLKKLAACGLLALGLFLMGDFAQLDSMRAYGDTATITTNDSAGYDGAGSGKANNLVVNGSGNPLTLTGTYQNLQSITLPSDPDNKVLLNITLGSGGTISNTDVLNIGKGYYDDVQEKPCTSQVTTEYRSTVKDVGTVNVGEYTSITTAGSWTIDNMKWSDAKTTQGLTINKGGYFTATGTVDMGSAYLTMARTQQGGTGLFGGGTLNVNTLKCGAYTQAAGTATVNSYASMKTTTITGGSLTVNGSYYVSGVNSTSEGFQGLKVVHNENMTNKASETKVIVYGAAQIGRRFENTAQATFYSTLSVNGLLENNTDEEGHTYEGVLTTVGNARAYTTSTDVSAAIKNGGTWNAYGNVSSASTLTNTATGTMNVDGMITSDFTVVNSYDSRKLENAEGELTSVQTNISGIWYGYDQDGKAYTGEISNAGTMNAQGGLYAEKNFTNSGTANFGSTVSVWGTLTNTNSLTTEGNVNVTGITNRTLLVKDDTYGYRLEEDESLGGSIVNSGEWTARGDISATSTFTNEGVLNTTGKVTASLQTITGKTYSDGQYSCTETVSGIYYGTDAGGIINTGTLIADGGLSSGKNFTNSGTATLGSTVDIIGALTNNENATLTTEGSVIVTGVAGRKVLTKSDTQSPVVVATASAGGASEDVYAYVWTFSDETTEDVESKIVNEGTWTANGSITVKKTEGLNDGTFTNKGTLTAKGGITVESTFENNGTLAATGNVTAKTIENNITDTDNNKFAVSGNVVADTITNTKGTMAVDGTVYGGTLTNEADGKLLAGDVSVTDTVTNKGTMSVNGDIQGKTLNNEAGSMTATNILATDAITNKAKLDANYIQGKSFTNESTGNVEAISVVASDAFANSGKMLVDGDVFGGTVTNNADATLQAGNVISETGAITNAGTMQTIGNVISEKSSLTNNGKLEALNIAVKTDLSNTGDLSAAGNLTATTVTNTKGTMTVKGNATATDTLTNNATLTANNVSANTLNNEAGTLTANSAVDVTGTLTNKAALTADTVSATTLNNEAGTLTANGTLTTTGAFTNKATANVSSTLTVGGKLDNQTGAVLTTNGSAKAVDVANAGTWTANGNVQGNTVDNSGTLKAQNVIADTTLTNSQNLTADTVKAQTLNNNAGTLTANDTVTADTLTNKATLNANSVSGTTVTNDGGTMTVAGAIKGTTVDNKNNGTVTADNVIATGKVTNAGNLTTNGNVVADSLENNSGKLSADYVKTNGAVTNAATMDVNNIQAQSLANNGGELTAQNVKTTDAITNDADMTVVGNVIGGSLTNNADAELLAGNVSVDGKITNKGTLGANGNVMGESLDNSKTLNALNVSVDKQLDNTGDLTADNISAATLNNTSGTLTANSTVTADTLTNNATLTANNISAKDINNNAGTLTANGVVTTTGDFTNSANATVASTLNVSGALTNNATGTLTTDGVTKASGDITNAGTWTANGNVQGASLNNSNTLDVVGNVNVDGAVTNSGTMGVNGTVMGESLDNSKTLNAMNVSVDTQLDNTGDLTADNVSAATLNNTSGTLNANSTVTADTLNNNATLTANNVLASTVNNKAGQLIATGTVAGATINNDAALTADNVSANALNNNAGTLTANGDVTVTNTLTNKANLITDNVSASTINNESGMLYATGAVTAETLTNDATLTADNVSATTVNNNSALTANNIAAQTINNTKGTLTANGTVTTSEDFTNDATATVASTLNVSGKLTNSATGNLTTDGRTSVAGTITNAGTWNANDNIEGKDSLTNSGTLNAAQNVAITNAVTNAGTITGSGSNVLTAGSVQNNEGKTISGFATVDVSTGHVQNDGTMIGTGRDSVLKAASLTNTSVNTLKEFGTVEVAGATVNTGRIVGTGIGSEYTLGSLNNSGANATIENIEKINVNGAAINSGTLEVMSEVNVNGGNFTNNGGTLNVAIDGSQISNISVTDGTATVNGGTLNVTGDKMSLNKRYVFLDTTDGLTVNEELAVNADAVAPKLFSAKADYDDKDYWLGLERDKTYGDKGETPNQKSVGTYLDKISYMLDTDSDNYENSDAFKVLSALDDTDGAQTLAALDQMSGTIYGNMTMMALQNQWMIHQNLLNIMQPLDCPFCCNNNPYERGHNVWGGFVGNTGHISTDGNSEGFNYDNAGVMVGLDVYRSHNMRLGAYFEYTKSGINERQNDSKSDMNNYDLGLYYIHRPVAGYVMVSGNVGFTQYDVTRRIAFGGANAAIDRKQASSHNSAQQSIHAERGWDMWILQDRALLRPFMGVTYAHMTVDGYQEHGVDGQGYVTNLKGDGYDLNSLRTELGARINACMRNDAMAIQLNGRMSWVHEYCDSYVSTTQSFVNADGSFTNPQGDAVSSFVVSSADYGRDWLWMGIGSTFDTGTAWTIFTNYDVMLNGKTTIHTGNLGVSFNW